jgi:hypothetical protein
VIRVHLPLVAAAMAALAASRPIFSASRVSHPAVDGRTCNISETYSPRFNAATLRQGRFVYREIVAEKDTGIFTLEIRRRPGGTWRFTGEGGGQHWESIADADFRPRSAELSLRRKGRPYRMRLDYSARSVRARETQQDSTGAIIEKRSSRALQPPTIDQRIDWASLMASDVSENGVYSFQVFDPASGSSTLLASGSRGPTMNRLGGWHATMALSYTICKGEEAEDYTVYATTDSARVMLREEMRGNVVAELVRIDP